MRSFLIAVLLAGAAASPALAQESNGGDHGHRRNHQQNDGGDQQAPAPRGNGHVERSDGGGVNPPQALQVVHQAPVIVQQGQSGGFQGRRFEGRPNVAPQGDGQQAYRGYRGGGFGRPRFEGQPTVATQVQVQPQTYGYRGPRGGYNGGERDQADQADQARNGAWNGQRGTWNRQDGYSGQRNSWNGQNGYYGQGQVVQRQVRDQSRWASGGWNRDWRNDRHYDWRGYRDQHRSIFHIGVYYDPFGYGYQQLGIGYRLSPAYFGQQYWINDPWDYQLPPPPPGTVWVRYWNDALLVDTYTGEVVDSIQGFFW